LYDSDMTTLAAGVLEFAPRFPLYSDGADKTRWVWLPDGATIDTSNPDYWIFPVGAKLWKEFNRDGVRVETRLTEKRPDGTWWRVAYQWREDQSDADAVPDGVQNASGTDHDIPSSNDCVTCHGATRGGVLGFSALQLEHDDTPTNLDDVAGLGWLSAAVTVPAIPGNAIETAALGYLHANCGTCHNPTGGLTRVDMDLRLRLETLTGAVTETPAYLTAVDQPISVTDAAAPGGNQRIASGEPNASAVYLRMHSRGELYSMPQLGTEVIDDAGSQAVYDWIDALP
ncbi:MAG TPA: hypothetical protein VLC09_15695, partial [Polyangiaceae bacterium]|nr:hypothetical protein [Polyangiaceae bacterium]